MPEAAQDSEPQPLPARVLLESRRLRLAASAPVGSALTPLLLLHQAPLPRSVSLIIKDR